MRSPPTSLCGESLPPSVPQIVGVSQIVGWIARIILLFLGFGFVVLRIRNSVILESLSKIAKGFLAEKVSHRNNNLPILLDLDLLLSPQFHCFSTRPLQARIEVKDCISVSDTLFRFP